jgi:hypothetical protein
MTFGFLKVTRKSPCPRCEDITRYLSFERLFPLQPVPLESTELTDSWNRGGKLPGLRGGPDARGCSGGSASDGEHCFSTRLMWRTGGAGEGE